MTTPTPQKSPREIAKEISYLGGNGLIEDQIIQAIEQERTAYNALLDKVQLIETERDDLKKRVDSEYDKGIEAASKITDKDVSEAILKLRRV